ncbi:MAG: hypothetical protein GX471_12795 [Candidatus Microthrix parvicella]|jgi:hypothetical protein|uniref:DUF7379 domain-containing protein n=1 Tax=Candidatus Neomicrothrix parvicella RN1 TaxID=1229780 RepID=R4Z259_9ACTN|nr:hypothetical protein [Candidatus Microthrix parvicella]MBP8181672.1 hypothetical protein [Acidimicrobiia bacterium]NLH67029.1 hypothetical protein [Candidatus Microthrix parvicella]CCM62697.1 hypothetical protein BN381_130255 [Candidatus Microthrix parvicella RN1]
MSHTTDIKPDEEVKYGKLSVRSIGVSGKVEVHDTTPFGLRAAGARQFSESLDSALAEAEMKVLHEIDLKGLTTSAGHATGRRAVTGGRAVAVSVPVVNEATGLFQVAVVEDELGAVTFHVGERDRPRVDRGVPTTTFTFPQHQSEGPTSPAGKRGVGSWLANKAVKIFLFKVAEVAGKKLGEAIVEHWEAKHHRHRFRRVGLADIKNDVELDCNEADWWKLAEGRSLLFIHGTNSRTNLGLGSLKAETISSLHNAYGERLFAFDHPTLSATPLDNLRWIAANLPQGVNLEVDIICHSRGGLVARALHECPEAAGLAAGRIKIGKVVMVATPNDGTVYADPDHALAFLDVLVTAEKMIPDNPVTPIIASSLAVLKQVACGAANGLVGLMSMNREGEFLATLNGGVADRTGYRALGADFEPVPGTGIATVLKDSAADLLFGSDANDLVVPTEGSFKVGDGSAFEISGENHHRFAPAAGVNHSTFWTDNLANTTMLDWLDIEGGGPLV